MFFFLILYSRSLEYEGSWSVVTTLKNGISFTETAPFHLEIDNYFNFQGRNYSNCSLSFLAAKNFTWSSQYFPAKSIFFPEFNAYYIYFLSPSFRTLNDSVLFMNAVIQSFNTKNFTFENIHKTIVDYILTTKFIAPFLISFNATVKDINGVPGLVGRELFSSKNVTFLSTLVDPTKIQKSIKIFTVILAFSVIFNYYGWKSINSLFTSMQPSLQLSPLSISLHATFDFAHTVFVTFKIPATSSESYLYLIFVVSAGMLVYVFFENIFSVRIHAIHTVDQTTIPFWIRFLSIIALHSCFIATHYYILENLSQYPLLSFITISSPFLPQIIYTFFNSNARKKDNVFIINELISKSIIILYYGFISNHIYKKIYPREASIAFGLLVFQAMLVILQNQFGSHLCFPDFLFAESYDYYQPHEIQEGEVCPICFSPIEIDDEVMVTPCEHAFHAECLQRWMEEELVCPMCRANLPPLR